MEIRRYENKGRHYLIKLSVDILNIVFNDGMTVYGVILTNRPDNPLRLTTDIFRPAIKELFMANKYDYNGFLLIYRIGHKKYKCTTKVLYPLLSDIINSSTCNHKRVLELLEIDLTINSTPISNDLIENAKIQALIIENTDL